MSRSVPHWLEIPGKPDLYTQSQVDSLISDVEAALGLLAADLDINYYTKVEVDSLVGGIDLSGVVPYTGATQNVDLGTHELTAQYVNATYLHLHQGGLGAPMAIELAINSAIGINGALTAQTIGGLNQVPIIAERVYLSSSTGPQLDNSSGTIRARTNNGLADAPFSAGQITASSNLIVSAGTNAGKTDAFVFGGDAYLAQYNGAGSIVNYLRTISAGNLLGATTFVAGSTLSPSVRFGADSNSGFYQPAAGQVGYVVNGTETFRLATGNMIYSFVNHQFYSDVIVGTNAQNGPRLKNSSGVLTLRNNADTADASIAAASFRAQGGNGIIGTLWINNSNDTWSAFQFPASQNNAIFSPGVAGGLFRFEGSTSAFPAFKRSGTTIQARLADDTADAGLQASRLDVASGGGVFGQNVIIGGLNKSVYFGIDTTAGNDKFSILSTGNEQLWSGGFIGWSNLPYSSGAAVLTLSRAADGLLQVGTTGANALGSVNLTNLTASGDITASSTSSRFRLGNSGSVSISTTAGGAMYFDTAWGGGGATYYFRENGVQYFQIAGGNFEIQGTRAYCFSPTNSAGADIAIYRIGANTLEINNRTAGTRRDLQLRNLTASGLIALGTYTVGTLPSASSNAGAIARVTDSNTTSIGATVAGGGANDVVVRSRGGAWIVVDGVISVAETFESVSKNLKSYPATYTYSAGTLTTVTYAAPGGNIVKTLGYTSGVLTSITLSGGVPSGISPTKTLTYTGDALTGVSYS